MANLCSSLTCSCVEKMQFVDCEHPILDVLCSEVPLEAIADPHMQRFFDEMLKFGKGEQSDLQTLFLVGLAAPQIGKNMRVILVDVLADGERASSELRLYINPEILEFSQETEEWYEGCYSTEDITGIVRRPSQVKIKALDREGNVIYETHSGFVARIFQHEVDHLNGIRFPERLPEQDVLHIVKPEDVGAYRDEQGWRNWTNTIPQKDWRECAKMMMKERKDAHGNS